MSDALRASGRPIVFSLCEWGKTKPWLWGKAVGNLWRTDGDIGDSWDVWDKVHGGLGVMTILDNQVGLQSFSGPGYWNDPDMLVVGLGGLSEIEYRAHFSLWAMLAAPLIAGNDPRNMDQSTKNILLNKEIIAIDQDPLGRQATRVAKDGDREVWARPLASGGRAVLLLNRGLAATDISIEGPALGYPAHLQARARPLGTQGAATGNRPDQGESQAARSGRLPHRALISCHVASGWCSNAVSELQLTVDGIAIEAGPWGMTESNSRPADHVTGALLNSKRLQPARRNSLFLRHVS
jgi:hypothetical protein